MKLYIPIVALFFAMPAHGMDSHITQPGSTQTNKLQQLSLPKPQGIPEEKSAQIIPPLLAWHLTKLQTTIPPQRIMEEMQSNYAKARARQFFAIQQTTIPPQQIMKEIQSNHTKAHPSNCCNNCDLNCCCCDCCCCCCADGWAEKYYYNGLGGPGGRDTCCGWEDDD